MFKGYFFYLIMKKVEKVEQIDIMFLRKIGVYL